MKIVYITSYDAKYIKNWSGLVYYIAKTLKGISEYLSYIGPLKEKYSLFFKAKTLVKRYLLNKNYSRYREPTILKGYAKQVSRQLSKLDADIIFSPGSLPISYLETDKPIVFWADATFASMIDFYPTFTNLCKETLKNGMEADKLALKKCTLAIYASDWAAQSAIRDYGADRLKVKVVPFGANIDYYPPQEIVRGIIDSRPRDKCRFLFIGVEWERKGGEIAYQVVEKLNRNGISAELNVVGCMPDLKSKDKDIIKCHGFLTKSRKEDLVKLNKLLSDSHFLILLSRAEAYGLVLCEANAFGVPCIATNVGGIPTIIKDDLNGKMFSLEAGVDDYCEYIASLFSNYSRYQRLALSAYNEFITRLNWSISGAKVRKLLNDIVEK